jgi:hypothetical protein
MRTTRSTRLALVGLVAAFAMLGAACAAPAPGVPPTPVHWSFKGTNVRVDNSQDEVCVLICVNRNDEPYLLQIAWRAKIGAPGSAQAWVVGNRSNAYNDLGAGESHALVGNEQAAVSFTNITPLDVLDALNSNNQMEIFGTYTWAMEQDEVGIQAAANSVANLFKDALNATVANATLPNGDTDALVDLVLDLLFANLGGAITILLSNIPLLGLGDDLLGGAFYVGIGATGTLASLIDTALTGVSIPALPLLGDNLIPPKIVGGGLYTLGGARNFSQAFNGAGGQHTYDFAAGPG